MTAVTGPFYFAWADETETTFGVEHQVEDEQIVSFRLDHSEGQIPTLNIDIRNPRRGLLSGQVWAWLSYDTGTVVPLFFGRLVGVPTNLLQEVVTLQFVAKPLDFLAQKQALAETLKVRPFWDPVFIDPNRLDDVETVLEGYSKLWHVDRLTHVVTVSHLIIPEDGEEVFTGDDVPYDSVQLTVGEPPLTSISVTGSVHWTQAQAGTIGGLIASVQNGTGLASNFPKQGSQLAGGYNVAEAIGSDPNNIDQLRTTQMNWNYENKSKTHANGDPMSINANWTHFPAVGGEIIYSNFESQAGIVPSEDNETPTTPLHMSYNMVLVASPQPFNGAMTLGYDAKTNRTETVKFTLAADLQAIVTLPEPGDIEEIIEINGTDVGLGLVGPTGSTFTEAPIGDGAREGYFPSDRGLWSLEYLIAVARAHIIARARAVTVTWDCPFDRAIDLSCRKSATLVDDRLPGGTATGKVTSYSLLCDGDAGTLNGNITIQCAIGHDGTVAAVAGSPSYVNIGYVEVDYQVYSGQTTTLGDVSYSVPVLELGGLVFPLTLDQVLVSQTVTVEEVQVNVGTERTHHINMPGFNGPEITDNTKQIFKTYEVPTIRIELKALEGSGFNALYDIDTSILKIPKQVDLEADATT